MIRGIIFDMGGVIFDVRIKAFLERFEFLTRLSKEEMYEKIINNRDWELFDKGLIDQESLLERIEKKKGISKSLLKMIADRWRKSIKVNEDVLDIVRRLSATGKYSIYALSNVDSSTLYYMKNKFPETWKYFDGGVLSCEVRMRKPEKAIYDYTIQEMGMKPEEAVLVDNYPVNLPPAEEMGMRTILFKSAKQLRKELHSMGVGF